MGALLAPISTATELAQLIPSYVPLASPWVAVRQRFDQLNQNISLTFLQKVDGRTKLNGVLNCLNQSYYSLPSGEANSLLIGSWGKDLATRPPRDVDVYFVLPPQVYYRFQTRLGNIQSRYCRRCVECYANLRPLSRMLKAWQTYCSVPIKSFHLELVAAEFVAQSPWRQATTSGSTGLHGTSSPIST